MSKNFAFVHFVSVGINYCFVLFQRDSLDGLTSSPSKRLRLSLINTDSNSSISFPSSLLNDTDMDLQLQSLLAENSVDLIAKFQDLIQQTNDDENSEGHKSQH